MFNNFKTSKWLVVLGAILMQICIGAVYTWSLFNAPLVAKFGWKKSNVVFTFSIVVAVFAFSTIIGGKLLTKLKVKQVATIGAFIMGIGFILSSTADSLMELYLYFGLIGGIGIGILYVCPLSTCIKWFPDHKGLITGFIVGAFGLGSLIFKSAAEYFIYNKGVSEAFFYLGLIYMLLTLIGAQFLEVPPTDTSSRIIKKDNGEHDFSTREMLKSKNFYLLWIIFFFGCISGLKVISLAKDIGIELIKLSPETAASAVSVIAIFNTTGRLVWGTISDKIGRIKTIRYMSLITALVMLIKSFVPANFLIFFILIALISFCFGGFLAVFPALTADFFGVKNLGINYGLMYQAYGIAAIVGPIIGSIISFKPAFLLGSAFSTIALVLTIFVKETPRN